MVRGSTQVYIMIGHPVSQVKSPEIFNERFHEARIDAVLVPVDMKPGGLPAFVDFLRYAQNVHGCIVTIPFKEVVTKYIDIPSPQVEAIGFANTLRKVEKGKIEGDMTDGKGYMNALGERGVTVEGKHLFVMGCGGAGAAVAWDALKGGARKVSLLDIDNGKAGRLRDNLLRAYPNKKIEMVLEPPMAFDMVMNATPLGMGRHDPLPMPIDKIPECAVVTDAVTTPAVTRFLKEAQNRGHIILSGPEMAAGQAPLIAEYFGIKW